MDRVDRSEEQNPFWRERIAKRVPKGIIETQRSGLGMYLVWLNCAS